MAAVTLMIQFITILVLAVLYVIGYWNIFKKAGEAGWKSIIPVYNVYTFFKISWKTSAFWVWLAGSFAAGALNGAFPDSMVFSIISVAIALIVGIIYIIAQCKAGFAFGKGAAFAIGLIFLNPLFIIILGLGSASYQGPRNS